MDGSQLPRLLIDRFFLAGLLACVSVLGLAGWVLFGLNKTVNRPVKTGYTHLHCPTCKAEYTYTPILEGQPCMDCEAETPLVPTTGSIRLGEVEPSRVWGKVMVLTLAAGVLIPLLVLFARSRLRAMQRAAAEREHQRLIWYCPYCNGKISYPLSKVGSGVLCSRCKTAFTLAAP